MKQKLLIAVPVCIVAVALSFGMGYYEGVTPEVATEKITDTEIVGHGEDPHMVAYDTVEQNIRKYANMWNSIPTSVTATYPLSESESSISEYANTPTAAFLIAYDDMKIVFGIPEGTPHKFTHVRAYIGMNEARMHLYFTPVTIETQKDSILNNNGSKYLMDLTCPCPSTCDTTSALYKAFIDQLETDRKPIATR